MDFVSDLIALAEGHCLNGDAGRAELASPRENSFLMPKKHRISSSDFKLIENSKRRRERGAYFILSYGTQAGREGAHARMACVVSKKTAARAVDRNLIKRRCRAAAGDLIADIRKPLVFIFYASRNAKGAAFAEIKRDVEKLIRKSCDV